MTTTDRPRLWECPECGKCMSDTARRQVVDLSFPCSGCGRPISCYTPRTSRPRLYPER